MDIKIYDTRYKSFKFNHKIRDKEFKALSHLLEFDLDHYEPLALRSLYMGANPGGGGGTGERVPPPHVFEGGGHNIKCPPPPPTFWGWMIIHLYNDPFYMVCDVVDLFFFFWLVRKVCHVGWVGYSVSKKLSHKF